MAREHILRGWAEGPGLILFLKENNKENNLVNPAIAVGSFLKSNTFETLHLANTTKKKKKSTSCLWNAISRMSELE